MPIPALPADQHDAAVGLRAVLERVAVEADPAWWRDHPTAALIRAELQRAKVAGIEPRLCPMTEAS